MYLLTAVAAKVGESELNKILWSENRIDIPKKIWIIYQIMWVSWN